MRQTKLEQEHFFYSLLQQSRYQLAFKYKIMKENKKSPEALCSSRDYARNKRLNIRHNTTFSA